MIGRGPVFYVVLASSLAVVMLAGVVMIGRLVMPQEPAAHIASKADAEAAARAMTFSSRKERSP
ncbi:MAG: hypothetical protein DCF30_22300 [Hyphomicrobiales bacterium]|nr:MAG: hypothetical protein DCF30_22300 [Hyphomicrobiales bacterium]